jgi:GR25 family glycosyltransferase involved in LPS biosynthesis
MKAFVIRKKDDELSEKLADECIASAKNFGITVEKFNGVYSNHEEYLNQDKLFPNTIAEKKLTNGYKGCFLSHYLIWKKCIEWNEPVLIFEHDAVMLRPITDEILNGFDTILVLDRFSRDLQYEDLLTKEMELKIHRHDKIDEYNRKWINRTMINGSHAHLVKPKGAIEVIDSIKKHGYVLTDVAVNQIYLTYYSIEPSVARVNPFFTLGKNRGHSHLKIY